MPAVPVIMPKLGAYTEDILLAQWLVDEGQEVEFGGVIFELETDKTNAEVEAETRRLGSSPRPGRADGPHRHDGRADRGDTCRVRRPRSRRCGRPGSEEPVGIRSSATSTRVAERPSPRSPAPSRRRQPRPAPAAKPRSERRRARLAARTGPARESSASRSTTRATSPAPGPAVASSTATSPPGLPAARQRRVPPRADALTVGADDPAARAARHDRQPHGLQPADRRPADLRARARREAARRAAHAAERRRAPHRASASRRSS